MDVAQDYFALLGGGPVNTPAPAPSSGGLINTLFGVVQSYNQFKLEELNRDIAKMNAKARIANGNITTTDSAPYSGTAGVDTLKATLTNPRDLLLLAVAGVLFAVLLAR